MQILGYTLMDGQITPSDEKIEAILKLGPAKTSNNTSINSKNVPDQQPLQCHHFPNFLCLLSCPWWAYCNHTDAHIRTSTNTQDVCFSTVILFFSVVAHVEPLSYGGTYHLCSLPCEMVRFLSASLYFSKRGAYWDRLCRDVVGWLSCACTVAKRCILGLELLWNTNRKPYPRNSMVQISTPWGDP